MSDPDSFELSCPFPIEDYPEVVLAHGGGGRLTRDLIERLFLQSFGSPVGAELMDGAVLASPGQRLALSTDSHVISPLFFPGGDIGCLSVYGTTNDLAMCGAKPLYLSMAFILEEGFAMEALWKLCQSIKQAAELTGVQIVTGDTKVVEKGKGDGIYINTSGIGLVNESLTLGPSRLKEGDAILVSGDLGRHGISVMASREGLEFETGLLSDCGSLSGMVEALLDAGLDLHCLRDLTRGGLATALVEICDQASAEVILEETCIPVEPAVQAACELLGLDPLYVANEGCMAVFLPAEQVEAALNILHRFENGKQAAVIGKVASTNSKRLSVKTEIGTHRILTLLSGEQLPRIC